MTPTPTRHAPPVALVIDDSVAIRRAFKMFAALEGFETIQAESAVEGMEMAMRSPPDAIFLDAIMPRADARSVLRILQRCENLRDVPIVIMTTRNETLAATSFLTMGAAGFMEKPFTRESLASAFAAIQNGRLLSKMEIGALDSNIPLRPDSEPARRL